MLLPTIRNTVALHSLQQEQPSAQELLRKLSGAVEQSADKVLITDRKGGIQQVNPAFEKLTGYTQHEACGKTPRILKSGAQGPETYQEMGKTLLAGQVDRGILGNRKKNGDLYEIEESISPFRDTNGAITHFVSNGRDLAERLRLEALLVEAQKMDAIGRLVGGIAHDFNNLLTIITSYSELALDAAPKTGHSGISCMRFSWQRDELPSLTRQLLALSRKQPQALRVVEVNQV